MMQNRGFLQVSLTKFKKLKHKKLKQKNLTDDTYN
jgi:hypothetical protein